VIISAKEAVTMLISAGLSQSEIARRIGVAQPTIHRILHGKQRGAMWSTAVKLEFLVGAIQSTGPGQKSKKRGRPNK
jgi:transcriptional regulator with XRE-family HTH domain